MSRQIAIKYTFESSRIDVSAPFDSNASHALISAALTAKNRTGIGNEEAFGLAPRSNNRLMVDFR